MDLRRLRVRCAHCGAFQVFDRAEVEADWVRYRLCCAGASCAEDGATWLEVPVAVDSLAGRWPAQQERPLAPEPIQIRDLTVRCAGCQRFPTLASFRREREHNVYAFRCEDGGCGAIDGHRFVEVPVELDRFAARDPTWGGGKRHAGSDN